MIKRIITIPALIVVLIGCFLLGRWVTENHSVIMDIYQEAVVKTDAQINRAITADTPVILEQAYSRCRHMVTSGYDHKEELVGKNLTELNKIFKAQDGYLVWFGSDGSLIIHRRIEDWCPVDAKTVHLGVFKDMVAVFKGPPGADDEMLKVTSITIDFLPEKLKNDLINGILQFNSIEEANYVLENLDEYE